MEVLDGVAKRDPADEPLCEDFVDFVVGHVLLDTGSVVLEFPLEGAETLLVEAGVANRRVLPVVEEVQLRRWDEGDVRVGAEGRVDQAAADGRQLRGREVEAEAAPGGRGVDALAAAP